MPTETIDALHNVHTATNDVLKGYREMSSRALPEAQAIVRSLTEMHERHATEQTAQLRLLREAGSDDASVQGTVNKVVVILRDWVSNIDRDVLPAVRDGEESLRKEYQTALRDANANAHPSVTDMLTAQMRAIDSEIARLPQN